MVQSPRGWARLGALSLLAMALGGPPARAQNPPKQNRAAQNRAAQNRAAQSTNAEQSTNADIAQAIDDLASTKFQVRQSAQRILVSAGRSAIDALEKASKSNQLDVAMRCVDALAQISKDKTCTDAALAALDRLAADRSNSIGVHAGKTVAELRMTDEDRALALLISTGARINRDSSGAVYMVSVTRDRQVAVLQHFPKLRYVTMIGKGVTDACVDVLASVKQLTNLTILGSSVSDVGLSKLKQLAALKQLSLGGDAFTSDGLRQLKDVRSLKSLLLHSSIDDSQLQSLAEIRQIDSLYLSGVHLMEPSVSLINQLKHLKRLTLSVSDIDDEQLRLIGSIELPFVLNFMRSPRITEHGLKHLKDAQLTRLVFSGTTLTDSDLKAVGLIRMLESLMIIDAPISDAGLEHLRELKALRTLSLRKTNVTDEGIARLRKILPGLRYVSIGAGVRPLPAAAPKPAAVQVPIQFRKDAETGVNNAFVHSPLTAASIQQLRQAKNLGTIFLRRDVTDKDLVHLRGLPIKSLVILTTNVTDAGVKALEGHPTLESLGIWESSITDRALESVSRIQSLTSLRISQSTITDAGLRELIKRLSESGKLTSLSLLSCPNISDDGLEQIGQITSLEELFLANNTLITSGLLKDVARLKGLKILELDKIKLDEDDLSQLISLTKLEKLSLVRDKSDSSLTNRGLAHISRLSSLKGLSIQNAQVDDESVSHLIKLKQLETLGMYQAQITDRGLAVLAGELPHLSRLGLSGSRVTNAGMIHLGKLTEMEWLWLDETEVGDEGLEQLDGLKKLKHLFIDAANVSKEAHLRLRRVHPETEISLK